MHHACHACGQDLSRLRAQADPYYALPIVTCPTCRTSVVRRRDPGAAGYRRARRLVRALLTMIVQLLVLTLVIIAAAMLINSIAHTAHWEHHDNPLAILLFRADQLHPDNNGPMLGILTGSMLMLGLFTGAWVRSTLHHLKPLWAWLTIAGLATLLAITPALLYWAWQEMGQPGRRPWGDVSSSRRWASTLTAGAMFTACLVAGLPLGRTARAAWAANWKSRRSKYRRARRRLREDR